MNRNLDDPNLTAFALGELSGAEKEAMEHAVAASPEAQARVEEIQSLARALRGEFRLDLQQAAEKRPSILKLLEQGNLWSDWRWVSLAAAAVLAVCALVAAVALSGRGPSVVAEKESKPRPEDTSVQMEVDTTPPELLASSAPAPAWFPWGVNTPAADQRTGENSFVPAASNPISTFPVQVDTAAYSGVRKSINAGSRPPKDAVRIEQMINYFSYDYPQPKGDRPFSITADAAMCPWQAGHQLVRIGVRGRDIPNENRSASNLVFLLDVSRAMHTADGLPLVKRAMRLLVDRLTEHDRVAIVVYAGASGVALPSTRGDRKDEIIRAVEELKADALTGGIAEIELAYRIAAENFVPGGVNRVIIGTDGELNLGVRSEQELVQLANNKARSGVALTMLRVGNAPTKNAAMQKLADRVGGSYAHLDSLQVARKVLLQQINATLVTIAKDVDVEVAFNPARVSSYRLIGYENALLPKADSNKESDGGEIDAGHTVTALYEIVPVGAEVEPALSGAPVNTLHNVNAGAGSDQLLTVKLRHKQPDGSASMVMEHSLDTDAVEWSQTPPDFRFAAAVAQFGMILRDSPHKGNGTLVGVLKTAQEARGRDEAGHRAGFVELLRKAQALAY